MEINNSNLREYVILYLDLVLRGLIAFAFIGIGFYLLLVVYLKVSIIWVLPMVFLASILVSPFLSRIKLGNFVLEKYEQLLNKIFEKLFVK
jgi:membrane protein implicated in regulation of membrane protease activity